MPLLNMFRNFPEKSSHRNSIKINALNKLRSLLRGSLILYNLDVDAPSASCPRSRDRSRTVREFQESINSLFSHLRYNVLTTAAIIRTTVVVIVHGERLCSYITPLRNVIYAQYMLASYMRALNV